MAACHSRAHRRYLLRLAAAMAAYLITLALAVRLVGGGIVDGPLAYLLAILPGLAVAGVFWAVFRLLIEEQDEYVRMLLIQQALVASGFTLTVVTIYGFLETFALVPHVDAFYVAVLWFIGLGFGSVYNVAAAPRGNPA